MDTESRLIKYLEERDGGFESVDYTLQTALVFLCRELDKLQPPAKITYKLCVEGAQVPKYQTEGASGLDLHARAIQDKPLPFLLMPGASAMVWAGVAFSIPKGWEIQIRPRSSLSKQLIHACLGTIDSDYRGEIGVLLINLGNEPLRINQGDRIAQAVFAPVGRFELEQVNTLDETTRGSKGFGSSGR